MASHIQALNEVSMANRAYSMIREAILDGELKPGERFTIESMAAQLEISRTPIREALKALESDGYIRLLPHRGAIVETYKFEESEHRYRIAALLDGYAAELACEKKTPELVAQLEHNCAQLEQICGQEEMSAEDARKAHELNREFHNLIRQTSGSSTLIRMLENLRQPTQVSLKYWASKEGRTLSVAIHRKIVDAIRAGDAKASRSLFELHLASAFERVTGRLLEMHTLETLPRNVAGSATGG